MDRTFPDVTLRGDRLALRAPRVDDAPAVAAACADPLTQRWLPLPNPYTLDHALWFCSTFAPDRRATGAGAVFVIEHEARLAGVIDLKRTDWAARTTEIGYWLSPWARGRGLMTAAVTLLTRWVIGDQGFCRVELRIAPGNEASQRVARAAGYTREGTLRNAGWIHAGRVDLDVFSFVDADLAAGTAPGRPQP